MKLKSIVLLLLCSMSTMGVSQSDFGTWSGIEVKAPLTKKLDVIIEGQLRFDRNSTRLKTAFTSPGLKYKIHKHIRLATDYRFSSIPFNNSTANRISTHRFTLDLEFKDIIDLFKNKSSLGLDIRFRGTHELERNKRDDSYVRARLKATYSIKKSKLQPNASVELFYHLNNQIEYNFTEVTTHNAVNKIRVKMGLDYKLKKRQELSVFGIYQRQLFSLENDFILGVSYSHELKFKNKKGTR